MRERELDIQNLIREERLKEEETRKFVDNAFRDGILKTTGTDIDRLMPPVSRFGGSGNRSKKKQNIIEKLKMFFDKYFGLVNPTESMFQKQIIDYQDMEIFSTITKVAEEPAPYFFIKK